METVFQYHRDSAIADVFADCLGSLPAEFETENGIIGISAEYAAIVADTLDDCVAEWHDGKSAKRYGASTPANAVRLSLLFEAEPAAKLMPYDPEPCRDELDAVEALLGMTIDDIE